MNVNVNLIAENVNQIKSGIMINLDVSLENVIYLKKDCNWSPTEHSCKNGEYLASIIDDSVIMCAEIIEETKTISTNLNEKRETCKTQNFFILLDF